MNVLFNDPESSLLPKQQETFEKYMKVINYGRKNPTRFAEDFLKLSLTDYQKYILLSSWVPGNVCWVCSRATGKTYMMSIFVMLKSLLFNNHRTVIMAPSGTQSQESFQKIESLAKGEIASAIGVSPLFLDEAVRANSKADCFVHDKSSYHVELNNGSSIESLNSVAKNIVGIRSNLNIYDEGGKIDRQFYALTTPFIAIDSNFVTGGGINHEIYPLQMPNQQLVLSSAEGIDSYLWDYYKLCANKMFLGDPNYFCCDLDCTHSTHPTMDGKSMKPLVSQEVIDAAFQTNPYKAAREYWNRFDADGGEDVLVKRSVINKFSKPYYPSFENDGTKKYIIAYDPAMKADNSVVGVAELIRDEEKGLMLKIVNVLNLIEVLNNGEKVIKQYPEQLEIIKGLLVDYGRGYPDIYDGIDSIIIDAGSGGGGTICGQMLMQNWIGKDRREHLGLIDKSDDYMKLRIDDFPQNIEKLTMFNFKANKTSGYERTQQAINQGLVILPTSLNARGELELEVKNADDTYSIKYEKPTLEEINFFVQCDLCKEELVSMQKQKRPNGTVVFDLTPEAKSRNMHDDHSDVIMMLCNRLMELRTEEALSVEYVNDDLSKLFSGSKSKSRKDSNPFSTKGPNPFLTGMNPFR